MTRIVKKEHASIPERFVPHSFKLFSSTIRYLSGFIVLHCTSSEFSLTRLIIRLRWQAFFYCSATKEKKKASLWGLSKGWENHICVLGLGGGGCYGVYTHSLIPSVAMVLSK